MPSRSRRRWAATGLALLAAAALTTGTGRTTAAYSDFGAVPSLASAGVWAPDPPDACGDPRSYQGGIQYGTPGDDVMFGGNKPQIILGFGGNDKLFGGNSGDCIVGGPGNDLMYGGNRKDILLGGPGDDWIFGGNAKDDINGEDDIDLCVGGHGNDTVTNCECFVFEVFNALIDEEPAAARAQAPEEDLAPPAPKAVVPDADETSDAVEEVTVPTPVATEAPPAPTPIEPTPTGEPTEVTP